MEPMKPMKPLDFGPAWWPETLGQPSSSGGQNGMRYAFFPDKKRLLIDEDGNQTLYDTADHQIGSVSQQGGRDHSAVFTSQHGKVSLKDLQTISGN